MNLIKTKIKGLVKLKPLIISDKRGSFIESYNKKSLDRLLGSKNFVQDNESESYKGVLRGLHFQRPPHTQSKLVRCVKGVVLDIALDLRKQSKTYGQYITMVLSSENKEQIFIPRGFAHGFIVMSEYAILSYKVDNYYNSKSEGGIIWNDPSLNIDWKINKNEIILSEKDAMLPTLNNFLSPF